MQGIFSRIGSGTLVAAGHPWTTATVSRAEHGLHRFTRSEMMSWLDIMKAEIPEDLDLNPKEDPEPEVIEAEVLPGVEPEVIAAPVATPAPEPEPEKLLPTLPKVCPLTIGGEVINAVNARDLHAFLGVGKMFTHWIEDRIQKYGFVEGREFEVFSETGKNPLGGRPSKEYAISLDMAKELAMVERNAKGKEVRAYFIDCEKKLLQVAQQAAQAAMPLVTPSRCPRPSRRPCASPPTSPTRSRSRRSSLGTRTGPSPPSRPWPSSPPPSRRRPT